jgi:aspartate-semialdehyde dehydrogenase
VDFTFFCGSEDLTRTHWRQALRAGSTVLDLSGALDQETACWCALPGWVLRGLCSRPLYPRCGSGPPRGAGVGAHSGAAATSRAGALCRRHAAAAGQRIWPRRLDELHQQTVNLLSFQGLPRAIYDAQAAYNLLGALGENAAVSLSAVEARIRRHYDALAGGRWPALALQVIHAPVFHGQTFSISVELERAVEVSALEEALSGDHVDLVLENTDSPSNLAATGQSDVLVRLRPEVSGGRNPNVTSRLWLWAACDNLRLNAQNAVECALDLRRLRPQGTVQ